MEAIRKHFPFFTQANEHVIFLDNAATTQKPQQVLDALISWYTYSSAPVHRGIYKLSEKCTTEYEEARHSIARFINAGAHETIFTKGTTESINFVATAWAEYSLQAGDEIIITELEHHANCVPWINVAAKKNLVLKYIPLLPDGTLDYTAYSGLVTPKTKLVSFALSSNALGTKHDHELLIKHARAVGAKVLVDAAQAVAHERIDVKKIGADFLAFSGHKLLGPTGIGVLYVAEHMHEQINPYQYGGGMVFSVDAHEFSWLRSPHKYEAGTPPIAQASGLAAAIRFIEQYINFDVLKIHEAALCAQLIGVLKKLPDIRILGPVEQLQRSGHMVSFVSDKLHAHDVAAYFDTHGICVRAGHHCAQLAHKKLGVPGSVRASFYAYTTPQEVQQLCRALEQMQEIP